MQAWDGQDAARRRRAEPDRPRRRAILSPGRTLPKGRKPAYASSPDKSSCRPRQPSPSSGLPRGRRCCGRWSFRRAARVGRGVLAAPGFASPGTTGRSRPSTRRWRSFSAPARSTTATNASIWSRLSRSTSASTTASRVSSGLLLPDAFLPFGADRVGRLGDGKRSLTVLWSVRYAPYQDPANQVGYFHATYADHPKPEPGKDLVLLDTRKAEGGGDWSGHFVGTSFIFSHQRRSQHAGRRSALLLRRQPARRRRRAPGTEEWGGGGDYWGGRNMTLPFAGHPVGAPTPRPPRTRRTRSNRPIASCSPTSCRSARTRASAWSTAGLTNRPSTTKP